MAVIISTILRAINFLGVSNAQFTFSVPAPTWHSEQSKPRAADMTPMVPMKSSTGIPLRTCMFLKARAEVRLFVVQKYVTTRSRALTMASFNQQFILAGHLADV